ncbi:MAG TPA: IS3 family transposase [Candidatus Paceibacterota bacterium]
MKQSKASVSKESTLSVRKQCKLLEINRSSVYYKPKGESIENLNIMRIMDEHYMEYPAEGVLRVQDHLLTLSLIVNVKRVRRLLRLMGIMALFPKRNLSKLGLLKYIRPYLLRKLEIDHSNQVWEIDITYIPMAKGFVYLTAIIDVYSRFIVAWDVYNTLEAENGLNVFKMAIAKYGRPEIINSDQGSQFTCPLWVDYLESAENPENKIQISMDGRGRAKDNIYIERFWRTVKYDYVYLRPAENGTVLYVGLKAFINRYNHKRHQGLGRKIPSDLYLRMAC